MDYVTKYYNEIAQGKIVTSKRVAKVYKKLAEDIANPKEFIFDEKRATRPIDFIERFCKHSKGEWAGKPVKLELFQKAYIQALFGFIHKDTKLRKYKRASF